MNEVHFVSIEELPEIPESVAVCPICGAGIEFVEVSEWEEDGMPSETGVKIECTCQPDVGDNDQWWAWFRWHYRMPYVDWLPVEEKCYRWLMKELRK